MFTPKVSPVNHVGLFFFQVFIAVYTIVLHGLGNITTSVLTLVLLICMWMGWAAHDLKKPTRRRKRKKKEGGVPEPDDEEAA